jgi:hypothetical protein
MNRGLTAVVNSKLVLEFFTPYFNIESCDVNTYYAPFNTFCIQGVPKFAKQLSSTLLSSNKISGKNV